MFHFSPRVFVQSTFACALFLVASNQIHAQALLANSSSTSNLTASSTAHDPVPARLISAHVHDGVLTVDGMIAKMQLNYNIDDQSYLYFFVPGVGTAVVSLSPMPGAIKVKNAFDGSKLSFTAAGHSFELTSQGDLLKSDAYIRFDDQTVALARTPRMGFGKTLQAPYTWPLSTASANDKQAHLVEPPALPASMMPRMKKPATTPVPAAPAAPIAAAQPEPTPAESQPAAPQAATQQ